MSSAFVTERQPAGSGMRSYWTASIATCAALFVIGVYTATLGPVLPDLAERAGMGVADAGILFSALFSAAIVSTMAAGRWIDRAGYRRAFAVGLCLNGAALLLLPFVGSGLQLVAFGLLLGAGDGAVVVAVHTLTAAAAPGREAAALNRLNVLFGVGAIAGPVLAAVLRWATVEPVLVLAGAGCAQIGLTVSVLLVGMPASQRLEREGAATMPGAAVMRSPFLWLLALLLLVYVGIEVGLGGWAFTYGREAAGLSGPAAALLSSGFWAALTVGRLLSPWVLRRWTAPALLIAATGISLAGSVLLLVAGMHPLTLWAGVVLTGIGFGPVWPVAFALAARAFPSAAGSASGVLAMVSACGGLFIPWLQGLALDTGGPAAGITVTVAGGVVLVWLSFRVRRAVAA